MTFIFRDIVGAERGFNVAADILTNTIDGVDLNQLWSDYAAALSLWNSQRDPFMSILSFDTTDAAQALPLDGGTVDFELASEFGTPKAGRPEPKNYVVGFPLEWYDLGARFTAKFLRDAPRSQVDAVQNAAFEADNRLQFKLALTALVTPRASGSRELNEIDAPIHSLYAGSSDDAPPSFAGRTFSASHNHYLVSGAADIDGQDLEDVIAHIAEHGHGINPGERIVLLVHPNEAKKIRGFRAGVASSPYDFIPSSTAPAFITTENIIGALPPSDFSGLEVIGSFGKALIVESYYAFAGYVVGVAVAGSNSPRNVLARRSHPRRELKGVQIVPGASRYPLVGAYYSLGVGFGVRNRGAAAVMQIKASGSYVAPSI